MILIFVSEQNPDVRRAPRPIPFCLSLICPCLLLDKVFNDAWHSNIPQSTPHSRSHPLQLAMFKFTALLTVATLAASVLAGPVEQEYKCNTAPVQCCNSYQSAQNVNAKWLSGLFDVDDKQVTGQAGFQCNPITVIGKGDSSKW